MEAISLGSPCILSFTFDIAVGANEERIHIHKSASKRRTVVSLRRGGEKKCEKWKSKEEEEEEAIKREAKQKQKISKLNYKILLKTPSRKHFIPKLILSSQKCSQSSLDTILVFSPLLFILLVGSFSLFFFFLSTICCASCVRLPADV